MSSTLRIRPLVVGLLVVGLALPAVGQTRARNYAREMQKQRGRALAAQRAAEKKAEKAAKAEERKRAADPAYAAAQEKREKEARDAQTAAVLVIGAVLLGAAMSSDSGGAPSSYESDIEERRAFQERQRAYWLDRARQEQAAGNSDEAQRALDRAR